MKTPLALLLCAASLLPVLAEEPSPLPVAIAPDAPEIRYVGRFTKEPSGPRCAWPGSTVEIRFAGTELQARFKEQGTDFWQVIVDGVPGATLALTPGPTLYTVASGLSGGEHVVQLVKRTEFFQGTTQFLGLRANEDAKLLPTTPPQRRIEIVGDSISCGYGNEAARKEEHFSPATENNYLAYGAVAARALGADYVCVACSGKKLWPDNSLVPLYDDILPGNPDMPKWTFASWTPQVVVLNLATNDFAQENPDEKGWTKAYVDFVRRLRGNYPEAHIYVMVGPMLSDWPPDRKPLATVRGYFAKIMEELKADAKIHYLDVGTQDGDANGYGADWHPSVKTDKAMADKLAAAIRQDLGW